MNIPNRTAGFAASVTLLAMLGLNAPVSGKPENESQLSLSDLFNLDITSASRFTEKASEAPATVYVISNSDIRARGYSVLSDLLKDLPGMETVEHYYSEQGTLVPVRGVVGNNKIVLLVNGMRVNPPGGEELMIRSDVGIRFADQIEIVYGPGSTLYGQDAISAIINIKTRRPEYAGFEALAGYGSFQSMEGYAPFSLRLRENSDVPISVTGYLQAMKSDLSDLREEFPTWWTSYQKVLEPMGRADDWQRGDMGANAFLRIESPNASIQAWVRESRRSTAEGSGEGGTNPVIFYVNGSRWEDRTWAVEGQHTLTLADGLTLSSILTFNRYEIDESSRYMLNLGLPTLYDQDFKYGRGVGTTLEEKFDYVLDEKTRFMLGVAAANYDIIPKASVLGGADPNKDIVTQAGTLSYYTELGNPDSRVDIHRTVDLQYRNYGAYAEGTRRFSRHLKAIAGMRVDVNSRYDDVPLSPRASLIYNPWDDRFTLKYIFNMAYVAPAPYFSGNIFDNGQQISSGNPDLKPERAMSNEMNATWNGKGFMVGASVYYNRQTGLIITSQSEVPQTVVLDTVYLDPNGGKDRANVRRITHSINLGSSDAVGFELSSRGEIGKVSIWGSYSYVDYQANIGGIESGLAQISRHNLRAGVTWKILPSLSATPSFVFRSTPENLTPMYEGMGVSLDNPYELNLSVNYSPLYNLEVYATGRNLTDNHYALRGVSGLAIQEPITLMAGVHYHY